MTTEHTDASSAKLAAKEFINAMKASDPWTDACWLCEKEYDEHGAVDEGLCFDCAWTHYYAELEEKKKPNESEDKDNGIAE